MHITFLFAGKSVLIAAWNCGKNLSSGFAVTTFEELQLLCKTPSGAAPHSCYTFKFPFTRILSVSLLLQWLWDPMRWDLHYAKQLLSIYL